MGSIGYLKQSNDIVTNSSELLDDILSSSFNQFIQGLGQPILVRYWNLNDTLSTANSGTDTTDEDLGPESPNRYNVINNLPMYGALRDVVLEITQNENLLDMEFSTEGTLLPDTIRPSTYDYFEYLFGDGRSILFKVDNVILSTIRSNSYYKIECSMVDIDGCNNYADRITRQVVKTFDVNLDTIGTNDKCIIESTQLKRIQKIDTVIEDILSQYKDLFYSDKYNAVVYDSLFDGEYLTYDPWLTKFLIQNNIFSKHKKKPIMLVNYDENHGFRQKYNMTFFHAVEIKSLKYLRNLRFLPVSFSKVNVNPFNYYGEEVAFKVDIFEQEHTKYTQNIYMGLSSIENNIRNGEKTPLLNEFECMMVDFFNMDNLSGILTDNMIDILEGFRLEYNSYWFQFAPILIYMIDAIKQDINNSYS